MFGTDGIRGEANRYPLDVSTALAVGQALTHVLAQGSPGARAVIGRDTRLSGEMLEAALSAGVMSSGGICYLAGVLPTPGIAFMARDMELDAGVVISASHNPYQDNGIKIFSGRGCKLSDQLEEEIEGLVIRGESSTWTVAPREVGGARYPDDAEGRYVSFLKDTFPGGSLEGLRIVVDCANGATYRVAPRVLGELGAEVELIHAEPDGVNINDGCGTEDTADLRGAVVSGHADIGLALDGDGDRLVAVDENGNALTGDQIIVICADMLKSAERLENDRIVSTVMSNLGLGLACEKLGLTHCACKVGDRYVAEEMRRSGAVLGGESSGHVVFFQHHTTGDGLVTALQVLAAMLKSGRRLSELAGLMEVFPQALVNVEVGSKPDLVSVPDVVRAIEQVECELKGEGRVLVRYSGTQSLCRVMVEAASVERAQRYAHGLAEVVRAALGE